MLAKNSATWEAHKANMRDYQMPGFGVHCAPPGARDAGHLSFLLKCRLELCKLADRGSTISQGLP